MCLAVPGKIISINNANPDLIMGKVDFGGVAKEICLEWTPEAKVGDYVLAHVGFALSIVDEKEALETIEVVRQVGELLDEQENDFEKLDEGNKNQNKIS